MRNAGNEGNAARSEPLTMRNAKRAAPSRVRRPERPVKFV